MEAEAVKPFLSVTVTVTEYVPALVYTWVGAAPVPVVAVAEIPGVRQAGRVFGTDIRARGREIGGPIGLSGE